MKNFFGKIIFLFTFAFLSIFATSPSIELRSGVYSVGSIKNTRMQWVNKPVVYDNGILFTFYGKKSDKVLLAGSFNNWENKISLRRNDHGIFYTFLTLPLKAGEYTYRYQVNGVWMNDEQQPLFKIDQNLERVSYFALPKDILFTVNHSPELTPSGKYRFYLKDKGYQQVSLISDQNNWNPDYTPLVLDNGYWYVDIDIGRKKLLYAYWVDGKKIFDPLNFSRSLTTFSYPVNYIIPEPTN